MKSEIWGFFVFETQSHLISLIPPFLHVFEEGDILLLFGHIKDLKTVLSMNQ